MNTQNTPTEIYKYVSFWLLLCTGILLQNCSTSKPAQTSTQVTPSTSENRISDVKRDCTVAVKLTPPLLSHARQELQRLSAEMTADIDLDGTSLLGSATFTIAGTDTLSMTINGPFGILIGKLLATKTSVQYYDALKNEVLYGNPESEALRNRMPIPLSYNDLIFLLRNEAPYKPELYTPVSGKISPTEHIYQYAIDERFVDFAQVKTSDSTILTYQRKSRTNDVLFNIAASSYSLQKGINFPKEVTLMFPPKKTTVRFSLTSLMINPLATTMTFVAPKSAKRIQL